MKEFDNLTSDESYFHKKVVNFIINLYQKDKGSLPPSVFLKSAKGELKLHPIPVHFFQSENPEELIEEGINAILDDYGADYACFGSECAFGKVPTSELKKPVKSIEDSLEQSVVLSFENIKSDDIYFYRFLVTDDKTLQIKELTAYTTEDIEYSTMFKLFKK